MRLLLFSGGVESTCLALIQRPDIALTIDYGQVCAEGEIRAASHIAKLLSIRHEILDAQMGHLGIGDLAGITPGPDIVVSEHWPFRNQMLITLAAMRYAREGVNEIVVGTVKSDHVHTDGNINFLEAMTHVLEVQSPGMMVNAPAHTMSTFELVVKSKIDRELLGWTFSCHRSPIACGSCRGCLKSVELFRNLDEGSENTAQIG